MPDTELREKIITSQAADRLLEYVSDIYDNAYVALWLYQVIGMEIDDLEEWTHEVRQQIFPQTATWGLEYWETLYNIYPNSTATISQRRQAILSRIQTRAPMNAKRIKRIAEKIVGVPALVNEQISRNRFEILLLGDVPPYLRDVLRKTIKEVKPAHLSWRLHEKLQDWIEYQVCFNVSSTNLARIGFFGQAILLNGTISLDGTHTLNSDSDKPESNTNIRTKHKTHFINSMTHETLVNMQISVSIPDILLNAGNVILTHMRSFTQSILLHDVTSLHKLKLNNQWGHNFSSDFRMEIRSPAVGLSNVNANLLRIGFFGQSMLLNGNIYLDGTYALNAGLNKVMKYLEAILHHGIKLYFLRTDNYFSHMKMKIMYPETQSRTNVKQAHISRLDGSLTLDGTESLDGYKNKRNEEV